MGFGEVSAKDKKNAKAASSDQAAKAASEDAAWEDNDKGASKKASRAAAKDDKADAKLTAKKEREELEAAEIAQIATKAVSKTTPTKVTQAEIARRQALMAMSKAAPKKTAKAEVVDQPQLEENKNRQIEEVEATGIDAAIDALTGGAGEKKTKMTYKEFEERVLPQIQSENPGLKMSQAKDKAFKMWERAPENPKNQEK